MDAPPAAPKPCCVCDAPNGKHCTKCKSRHYCSKKCQLFDWKEGGHKAQCRQLAILFQDRLLDELMPAKKVKEVPAIVDDVPPAAGATAAARLSAARTTTTAVVKASALKDDTPDCRGTCAICLELLPFYPSEQASFDCCSKSICKACAVKCRQHDDRCPLCRTPVSKSAAESLCRVQKQVDKGNVEAQVQLGDEHRTKDPKQAFRLYELAAAQGHARAQFKLGTCYNRGSGVTVDYATGARWYQSAAEQGLPEAQLLLGIMCCNGKGVARSYEDAVKWFRLAAAQGVPEALYRLGACYYNGHGVPQDCTEALRLFKRAAAQGHAGAAAQVELAAARPWKPT